MKLSSYLKNFKKEVILGPIFKLLEAVFELFVPLVMANVIDVGVKNGDVAYILSRGGILIALAAAGLGFSLTCQYFASRASQGTGTLLRRDLFRHIGTLSYRELDTAGTPTLITRITSDVNQVQQGVAMIIRLALRSPILVVGCAVMALTVDLKLGSVFLIVIPLMAVVLYLILKTTTPMYKVIQAKLDRITLVTRENLSGQRVVRAFAKEKTEIERFDNATNDYTKTAVSVGRITALLNPLTYVVVNLAIVAVVWFGGIEVSAGGLTQGKVLALVNYLMQILFALVVTADLVVIFTKSSASLARLKDVFALRSSIVFPDETPSELSGKASAQPSGTPSAQDETPSAQSGEAFAQPSGAPSAEQEKIPTGQSGKAFAESCEETLSERAGETGTRSPGGRAERSFGESGGERSEDMREPIGESLKESREPTEKSLEESREAEAEAPPAIEFKSVTLRYADDAKPAVEDLDFRIARGGTLGIIGGTGSGKSSVVNLIPRFYDCTAGEVRLFGKNVRRYAADALNRLVAVVPQKAALFSGSIRSNLLMGDENASDAALLRALETAQAAEFVSEEKGGLDAKVEQNGRNFSGGQKQRLSIARALVKNAPILILDDSASALDYKTDANLRRALRAERGEKRTTVYVSQRVATVKNSDLILVLDGGKLVGAGTHEQLLKNCGVYFEINRSQTREDA